VRSDADCHEKRVAGQRRLTGVTPGPFDPHAVGAFEEVWIRALGGVVADPVDVVKDAITLIAENGDLRTGRRAPSNDSEKVRREVGNVLDHEGPRAEGGSVMPQRECPNS